MANTPDLEDQILSAHDRHDHASLVTLYFAAADRCSDIDEECFFLTYAYIYALELNHSALPDLHDRLSKHGRI